MLILEDQCCQGYFPVSSSLCAALTSSLFHEKADTPDSMQNCAVTFTQLNWSMSRLKLCHELNEVPWRAECISS